MNSNQYQYAEYYKEIKREMRHAKIEFTKEFMEKEKCAWYVSEYMLIERAKSIIRLNNMHVRVMRIQKQCESTLDIKYAIIEAAWQVRQSMPILYEINRDKYKRVISLNCIHEYNDDDS